MTTEQQSTWRLTNNDLSSAIWSNAQLIQLVRRTPGGQALALAGAQAGAEAQGRKLVEWLNELCPEHNNGLPIMRTHCYECFQRLRREVGLDAKS